MKAAELLPQINKILNLHLHLIEDVEAYFLDPKRYPDSYREVMTLEEEMTGSMYSTCAFADKEGNLVGLNLFGCQLSTASIDQLCTLSFPHLTSLNLARNQLDKFNLSEHFSAMVCLNLSENPQLRLLGLNKKCTQLSRIDLFDCALERITFPATYQQLFYIDLGANKSLTDCTFLGGLESLQVLFLRGTNIQECILPAAFPKLIHLYLNDNPRLARVSVQHPLPSLSTLQLKNAALGNFSEEYIQLGTDEIGNEQFWDRFEDFFPKIDSVFFTGNPIKDTTLSTKLVDEDGQNNLNTLRQHFAQRKSSLERDNENKVLLIGNGNAGKTNILKRFVGEDFNPQWDSTHGIIIHKHHEEGFDLYFWDFGGQDIYHNTHRLFMQQEAVYVLAWRKETELNERTLHPITLPNGEVITRSYRNHPLDYWLNYARQLGKGSPMIVTQTNIAEDGKMEKLVAPVKEKYAQDFPEGLVLCYVESHEEQDAYQDFESLKKAVIQSVKGIKNKQEKISAALFQLREYLRGLQEKGEKTLSLETYRKEAREMGVLDPDRELKTWLFRTGVVYFQEGVFDNRIILDQTWAINAIYALFDRSDQRMDEIRLRGGEFTGQKLREIWAKEYPNQQVHEMLLSFMLDCDICYEVDAGERHPNFEQRRFVAPKLLREDPPYGWEKVQQKDLEIHASRAHYVKYTYSFLHDKLMESLIARTAYLADEPWYIWQQGTRIAEDGQILFAEQRQNDLYISFNDKGGPLFQKMHQLITELQDEKPEMSTSEDGYHYSVLTEDPSGAFSPETAFLGKGKGNLPLEWIAEMDGEAVSGRPKEKPPAFEKKAPQPQAQPRPFAEVYEMISKDYLAEAVDSLLKTTAVDDPKYDELVLAKNRIYRAEQERNGDRIAYDEYDRLRNRQAKRLLDLIRGEVATFEDVEKEEPESGDLDFPTPDPETKKKSILILDASPENKGRLRTDEEYKEIRAAMRQGECREEFLFLEREGALTMSVFQRALRQRPHIVHFSGHGDKDGIYLMKNDGHAVKLEDKEFIDLLAREPRLTELVILNACHSNSQAKAVSSLGILVLGTRNKIWDKAAITFSKGFYEALADGTGYEEAFKDAKMQVKHEYPGHETVFEAWYNGELCNW